jgi:hypothetical protein
MRVTRVLIGLLMCFSAVGCASLHQVQAWEKGKLARQEMKFDRDLLEGKFVDHIYFSKEAATGGTSVGGGGCGCN